MGHLGAQRANRSYRTAPRTPHAAYSFSGDGIDYAIVPARNSEPTGEPFSMFAASPELRRRIEDEAGLRAESECDDVTACGTRSVAAPDPFVVAARP
jgi:hypothetical protein